MTTVHNDDDVTHVLAVVDQNQLQHLLARVVDPDEFLSPFGLRSLSKYHEKHPFVFGERVGRLRAGGVAHEAQGRQQQLARTGVVPDDVPDDRVAAQAGEGIRRQRARRTCTEDRRRSRSPTRPR